jgi:uncharacterized protein involved in cysteine biosynthesis
MKSLENTDLEDKLRWMLDKKAERIVDGWNSSVFEFIGWLCYLYLQDLLLGFA